MKKVYPKEIRTERLLLRPWKEDDLDPFHEMNSDPQVMEHFPSVLTEDQTLQTIEKGEAHFEEWGYGPYACQLLQTGQFIGSIGLFHPEFEADFTPCVEILWRLQKEVWGQGLASEGARAVLKFAFDVVQLKEVYSFTTLDNVGSRRVMEKIGMECLGTFDHPKVEASSPLCKHWLYRIQA